VHCLHPPLGGTGKKPSCYIQRLERLLFGGGGDRQVTFEGPGPNSNMLVTETITEIIIILHNIIPKVFTVKLVVGFYKDEMAFVLGEILK